VADWAKQKRLPAALLPSISVLVLVALTAVTYRQIRYWDDNLAMWSRALQVTQNNWVAEDMVAGLLASQGPHRAGRGPLPAALAILPSEPTSSLMLAIYEHQHGNPQEAIRLYKVAVAGMDDPLEQAKLYQNMAVAYRDLGDQVQFAKYIRMSARSASRPPGTSPRTPSSPWPAAIVPWPKPVAQSLHSRENA